MQSKEQHQIKWDKNDPNIGPGDPYPFEGKTNPYLDLLKQRGFMQLKAIQKRCSYT